MYLHLYAQEHPHEEAYIVGTREKLIALRDAIDRALEINEPQSIKSFTGDGEGYSTIVMLVDDTGFVKFVTPYTKDTYGDPSEKEHPFNLLDDDIYRKLMK